MRTMPWTRSFEVWRTATGRLGKIVASAVSEPMLLALALTGLALVARLYGLGEKPLWYDEVLPLKRAGMPLAELATDAFRNKHYPTYFVLVSPFAGSEWSAWALRLPSALIGAVCVFLVARIAHVAAGGVAAVTAGLLMALSPMEVQFGQEARSYTLTSAAILLSMWTVVRLTSPGQQQPRDWLAYCFATALALVTLSAAAPWFIAANLAVLAMWQRGSLRDAGWMRRWVTANALAVACWLPALAILVSSNKAKPLGGLMWTPPLTPELVGQVFGAVYGLGISDLMTLELFPTLVPGFGIAVAALAAVGAWRLRTSNVGLLLGIGAAAMPLVLFALSLFHPLLLPRYLLWSAGPYFVLAGVGVATVPRTWQPAALAGVAVGAALSLLPYYASETKPRWDLAASYLAARVGPNDAVVTSSTLASVVVEAYVKRSAPGAVDAVKFRPLPEVEARVAAGGTVWLVHGRAGQGRVWPRDSFLDRWRVMGAIGAPTTFGRHIAIWRMVPEPPDN